MKNLKLNEMVHLTRTIMSGRNSSKVGEVDQVYEHIKKVLEEGTRRLEVVYSFKTKMSPSEYAKVLKVEADSLEIEYKAFRTSVRNIGCIQIEDIILEDFEERIQELLTSYGYKPEEDED